MIPIITLIMINVVLYILKKNIGVFGDNKVYGANVIQIIKLLVLISLNTNLTYSVYL